MGGMTIFHRGRRFGIKYCSTLDELIEDLVTERWVLCQGWRLNDCLFLNDSFPENSLFDIAVMRIKSQTGTKVLCDQLDSLIINLYGVKELQERIRLALTCDTFPYGEERITAEPLGDHKHCMWCVHEPRNLHSRENLRDLSVTMMQDRVDGMA